MVKPWSNHGQNPPQVRLMDGEYYPDAPLVERLIEIGYNSTRCRRIPDALACDLCHDETITAEQVSSTPRPAPTASVPSLLHPPCAL